MDPRVVDESVKDDEVATLLQVLIEAHFHCLVPAGSLQPQSVMENPLVKYNFEFAEQKRLVSKIFTMMVRDHHVLKKHPNLHLDLFRLAV